MQEPDSAVLRPAPPRAGLRLSAFDIGRVTAAVISGVAHGSHARTRAINVFSMPSRTVTSTMPQP